MEEELSGLFEEVSHGGPADSGLSFGFIFFIVLGSDSHISYVTERLERKRA